MSLKEVYLHWWYEPCIKSVLNAHTWVESWELKVVRGKTKWAKDLKGTSNNKKYQVKVLRISH